LNHKKKVQVLFGYYGILQANLAGLEKKMQETRQRQAIFSGGSRQTRAFRHEVD
jgi:hypothetical protein